MLNQIQSDALRFALYYDLSFKKLKHMYERASICCMALNKMFVAEKSKTHPELVCTPGMFYVRYDFSTHPTDDSIHDSIDSVAKQDADDEGEGTDDDEDDDGDDEGYECGSEEK